MCVCVIIIRKWKLRTAMHVLLLLLRLRSFQIISYKELLLRVNFKCFLETEFASSELIGTGKKNSALGLNHGSVSYFRVIPKKHIMISYTLGLQYTPFSTCDLTLTSLSFTINKPTRGIFGFLVPKRDLFLWLLQGHYLV